MTGAGPKVLVIGKSGQVAQALAHVSGDDQPGVICLGRPEVDLGSPDRLLAAIEATRPEVVINTGAFTDVDGAETRQIDAYRLNRDGVAHLWQACSAMGARLVHLSTDCVFDGRSAAPYTPMDAANPLGIYGQSKWAGEQILRGKRALIVRVSWIYSRFGRNFLTTMLDLARTRARVRVVNDQIGCPSHAEDLACALLTIARRCAASDFEAWGTYHLAGQEATDRASQAQSIFVASRALGGPWADVDGVPSASYPTPARRPLNARLDSTRTRDVFGVDLPGFTKRLKAAVAGVLDQE